MFFKSKFGNVTPPFEGKARQYNLDVKVSETFIGHTAVLWDNVSGPKCTAFYINNGQVFVTVAHTFYGLDISEEALKRRDTNLIVFLEGSTIITPVFALNIHESTDIAVGGTPAVENKKKGWQMSGVPISTAVKVEEEDVVYLGFEKMRVSQKIDKLELHVDTSLVISTFLGELNDKIYVQVGSNSLLTKLALDVRSLV